MQQVETLIVNRGIAVISPHVKRMNLGVEKMMVLREVVTPVFLWLLLE